MPPNTEPVGGDFHRHARRALTACYDGTGQMRSRKKDAVEVLRYSTGTGSAGLLDWATIRAPG